MPLHTLGDIQTAGEYLVYGIRTMYHSAHRRIAVMGHSQGGMSMRWALRFWPDTRAMVDDVIGMAGSNHGTTTLPSCKPGLTKCTPAVWQQLADANFVKALNSGAETFAGISYTEIFTHTDEVVQPNSTDATSSSALHTGAGAITNVSTQDICPLDLDEHLAVGTIDPVTYALAMDALDHAGPAKPSRRQPGRLRPDLPAGRRSHLGPDLPADPCRRARTDQRDDAGRQSRRRARRSARSRHCAATPAPRAADPSPQRRVRDGKPGRRIQRSA